MDDEKLKVIESRLDTIEKQLKALKSEQHRPLIGSNVWVLVPIVAIVMWGLQNII